MKRRSSSKYMIALLLLTAAILLGKLLHQSGAITLKTVLLALPIWLFWLLHAPIVWWLSGKMKLTGPLAAITITTLLLYGLLVASAFTVIVIALDRPHDLAKALRGFPARFTSSYPFAFLVYFANVVFAYFFRFLENSGSGRTATASYENSILVKTSFGYVLVEIESFKYVKDGDRKILFETGRSTPLNRQRVRIPEGRLVEADKYRNDRNIVINLANIRRAVKRSDDEYVFFIGFSHELHLNAEMYRKLGGWLPRPALEQKGSR